MTINHLLKPLPGLLAALWIGTALANEKVRVAFREDPGYCFLDADGERQGYTVEWIKRLALRFSWDVEWVDVPRGRVAESFESGDLDLATFVAVPGLERESFRCTRMPIGCIRMALFVPQNSIFDADDLDRMDGLIVGVQKFNPMREKLVAQFAANGLRCVCREFDNERELESALADGRIGAVLGEITDTFQNVKPVLRMPPLPFFIAVSASRLDLLDKVDAAITEIADSDQDFVRSLRTRFFRNESVQLAAFSAEERAWIARQVRQNQVFTVDVSPADGYLKVYDEQGGVIGGFVGRILSEVSSQTGIMFHSLRPRSGAESATAFDSGEIDISVPYGCSEGDPRRSFDPSRIVSVPVPQAVVTRHFAGVDITDERTTIAVVATDHERIAAYERLGMMSRSFVLPTVEEAVKAVVAGKVDCFLGDYPLANRVVRNLDDPQLADVRIHENARYRPELQFMVGPKVDRNLVSVLSKLFALYDRDRLIGFENDAEAKEFVRRGIEFRDLVRYAGGVLITVLLVIIAILLYYGTKTRKLLHKSEASLMIAQDAIDDAAMARTKMREALEEAEYAAKSKSNFLATMSHEIRTPLNAVVGFSELLTEPGLSREKVVEYARGISLSANSLLSLINDVLDFCKSESGHVQGLDIRSGECDFETLLTELDAIFRLRAENKGLVMTINAADTIPPLVLSEPRMRQILMNLIGNAVKFTDRGGISVSAKYAGGTLTIKVADTGIGITPRGIRHIFDPFSQDMDSRGGKVYAGTGLGLSIVKKIVEASGGTVSVESVIGKGSTFTVTIPGVKRMEVRPPSDIPPAGSARRELHDVVIVDDVAMNRKVLELHCKSLGIVKTKVFASAVEVLEYLKNPENPCDLVLSDVWMPGINGAELARQCATLRPALPVVAVTADTDAAASFDISLFKGVLTKPITADKLARLLSNLDNRA